MRICIIDDNAMVLDALVVLLREQGHEVLPALHALDGIDLVGAQRPDAVVVDIELPGMSGIAAAAEIRAAHPTLPIVLTSGRASLPPEAVGAQGADFFLAKPFTPKTLVAALLRAQDLRAEA